MRWMVQGGRSLRILELFIVLKESCNWFIWLPLWLQVSVVEKREYRLISEICIRNLLHEPRIPLLWNFNLILRRVHAIIVSTTVTDTRQDDGKIALYYPQSTSILWYTRLMHKRNYISSDQVTCCSYIPSYVPSVDTIMLKYQRQMKASRKY